MSTIQSQVTFRNPFTLNRDVGELPAGTYEIEMEQEEISVAERTAHRRTALRLYVQKGSSTRVVTATPKDFDRAVERDGLSR